MTYEPFALEPEYIEANRAFIANMDLERTERILDLACGIGTMTDLLLEKKKKITVVGMDISRESLSIGKDHFFRTGDYGKADSAVLSVIQASADCLPAGSCLFDGSGRVTNGVEESVDSTVLQETSGLGCFN